MALSAKPKKALAKNEKSSSGAPAAKQLTIVSEVSTDTPTYYVNHAEIGVSDHEYSIWFSRLPTKLGRSDTAIAMETGEIVIEPEFQILFPLTMIDGLISALQAAKQQLQDRK